MQENQKQKLWTNKKKIEEERNNGEKGPARMKDV